MSKIRELPAPTDGEGRVETGPVQFGDDWPGTFVRGDNGMGYAMAINMLSGELEQIELSPIAQMYLRQVKGIADLFGEALVK